MARCVPPGSCASSRSRLAVLTVSCRADDPRSADPENGSPGASTVALPPGDLTVLAAASLTDVFGAIADEFEAANPGVTVEASFAASSTLAAQIRESAPADVFAAADETTSAALAREGLLAGDPVVFARNGLAIAVAPGNPLGITDLADLADPSVTYIAAAPAVPISVYADRALADAGVAVQPVSREADVRAVLTKVAAGEADAGIVYATDVAAADGAVTGIDLPAVGLVASYPAATLRDADRPDLAAAFVGFLLGPVAQRTLAAAGFGPPP